MTPTAHDLIAGTRQALRLGAMAVLGSLGVVVVVLGSVAALVAICAMPLAGLGRRVVRPAARTRRPARAASSSPAHGLGVLRQDAVRP
jgi:hypothetical protein